MKFVIHAPEYVLTSLRAQCATANWISVNNIAQFEEYADADAFFSLYEDAGSQEYPLLHKPLFIHSVVHPVAIGQRAIRINAWNGFLENKQWEIIGMPNEAEAQIFAWLQKSIINCTETVGFIAPRVLAMIINEAYFALSEAVSTAEEIDTAMKLGTNYPMGPIEWSKKIGLQNIYHYLQHLSMQDERYLPAPLLQKTAGF